ncbi:hypothetical protein ACFFHQ_17805, partial [Geobacillus jurassicus]
MRLYETNRLILRELDETFALTVLNYYQRNKDFLKEWEAERPEDFFTLEYQSERLKKDIELTKSGSILKLWLFHKCQGRLFFPQNRRFKIPQKDLMDPSVFLVGAFFPV